MPKYARFQYGQLEKYGKYILSTTDGRAIGEHIRYRMRTRRKKDRVSDWVTMSENRVAIQTNVESRIRVRSKDGSWVYAERENVEGDQRKMRIRSISNDGTNTPWVYSERGEIKEI